MLSLSWGSSSLQRSSARRSRFTRRFPAVGTLRPQGSGPLSTLSLPFEPSSRCRPGRSWDSHLQGFSPPGNPALFRVVRALLTLLAPHRRTLAVTSMGPAVVRGGSVLASRRVSRLQGFPCRESVPLRHWFMVAQRPMPSWFSSSLRSSPDVIRQRTVALRSALVLRPRSSPLRVTTAVAPQRLAGPRGGLVSLETASLSEVSPLGLPTDSNVSRRWVMVSPRGRSAVTGSTAPRFTPFETSCRSSMGRPLGPR